MKKLKISLVVIVVAAICAGIFFWIERTKEFGVVKEEENPFITRINDEIDSLKAMPESNFCRKYYNNVAFNINHFYKESRFGDNQSDNDQRKENFERDLYSVYADLFIKQAFYVFRNSEWEFADLEFIQVEKNTLKGTIFLVAGSLVDRDFTKIQTALNKYYEIVSFISSCNDFSYSDSSLSARFPIDSVQDKIERATSLRNNSLENEYVNNCNRLHDELNEIPQLLFNKHVWYLDNKIDYWSNMWCNFYSHSDYSQNLNVPLREEINDLGTSTIYRNVNVNNQYARLLAIWSLDNQNAYNATYPCN